MRRGNRFFGSMPSTDIKISQRFLASDGWKWQIDASDYGWTVSNSGYETYTNDEDDNFGSEKNYELALKWLKDVCKQNNWTLKRLIPKKKPDYVKFAKFINDKFKVSIGKINEEYWFKSIDNTFKISKEDYENIELILKDQEEV